MQLFCGSAGKTCILSCIQLSSILREDKKSHNANINHKIDSLVKKMCSCDWHISIFSFLPAPNKIFFLTWEVIIKK